MRGGVSELKLGALLTTDYAARTHGFPANRRWSECAQSSCDAAPAVSFSPLCRELSRSYEHRVCDAWDEGCWPNGFGHWHGVRDFLCRLFRSANSGRPPVRTLQP